MNKQKDSKEAVSKPELYTVLPAVFLSVNDKQEQFQKELKSLLLKYKAELTIEDFGRDYLENWKIVVDFEYDESFFEKEDTGIVPQLIIGRCENGKE